MRKPDNEKFGWGLDAAMEITELMHWINDHAGLWAFGQLVLLLPAFALAIWFVPWRKRSLRGISFCPYIGSAPSPYPNRLFVRIKNQSGADVIIWSAYLRLSDDSVVKEAADRDCGSGMYELKFSPEGPDDSDEYSENLTLVKNRKHANTYVPLHDDKTIDDLHPLECGRITLSPKSYVLCDVVHLEHKVRVSRCKIPIRSIQDRRQL